MTDAQDRLARLTPAQLALLRKRMADRGAQETPRRDPRAPAPLSPAQRRLWFVQMLAPQSTAYNLHCALRLRGPMDPEAMRAAFDALVSRHETLRARFGAGPDAGPRQMADVTPRLALRDMSGAPDPEAAAQTAMEEIVSAPHDLARGAARAGLLRLGAEDHLLAIGLHHIVADRWSLEIIVRELALLYAAARAGEGDPPPPVAMQMADAAAAGPAEEETRRQVAWWREQLAAAPALDLPRDRRPGAAPVAAGSLDFAIPPELTQAARAAARARGVSLYTLMLTVCAMLMSRYGDAGDLVLGSDVSLRAGPQMQGIVGPLLNTLALRIDLSGDPGLDAALDRATQTLRAAWARQDAPLDQVVEALNPERLAQETIPIFRAKFDLQQAATLPETVHGLAVERVAAPPRAPKYELRFNLEDHGTHLSGRVEYRADLYDAETMARMAQHYLRLLRAALAAPQTPLSALEMLSAQERAHLLTLAEGPALPPHPETLHAAFEAQADRAPQAVALSCRGGALSYAALDARANAVAAALIARGLAAQSVVGVCLRRTPDLVAAILGVLKAGCAYLPLDPAYPAARLKLMLEECDVALTLTDGAAAGVVETGTLDLSDLPESAPRPAPRGAGDGLAVVIYTSGSTGRPKGAALEHRNILARVAWAGTVFTPEDFAGMLFATSVSFDLSLFEIFATLGHGGRLVLAESLLDWEESDELRFISTVPSLMRDLVVARGLPSGLRAINLAGEFFPGALLDRLLEFAQLRVVHNLYGPTEDAIYDAGQPVQDEPERPMPIGRPLPGARIHILDRNGALAPQGAAGELWVGGAGLARGYVGRPDLTDEKFRPDPFQPGARLYRSGDRGRWRADGRIDILGRIDGQVKIRGQRIETAEIESALEAHPDIIEAAVLATGAPGAPDRRLAAHLGLRDGATPEIAALRAHLAARLPRHFIPDLWDLRPGLPRLPNGKIDRKTLAAAELDRPDAAPAPPANETERRVIALWAELLGRDDIGAEDDFFARGGHSLLAMRLLTRLQQEFGVALSLGRLFAALTPRAQAEAVLEAQAPTSDDPTAGLSDAEVDALLASLPETTE